MAIKTYEAFKAPSPYEQERLRAERQRRYAELLEQQAMEPEGEFTYQGIRAMPSPAAALGKLLSAYQGKKAREKAEEAEARKTGMEEEASRQIMNRLIGGRPVTDANTTPDEFGLAEIATEAKYTVSPELTAEAMRMAMTPQGVGAVRGNPMLAAALQRSMEAPSPEEFGTEPFVSAEGEYVLPGKRGTLKKTGIKAPAEKPAEMTPYQREMLNLRQQELEFRKNMTGANRPMSATAQRELFDADENVLATESGINMLDQAIRLSPVAYEGVGASQRATAATMLPDAFEPKGTKETLEFDLLLKQQVLPQLKSIFGSAPTEGERAILLELQGSSSLPKATREAVLKRARQMANQRLQFNKQKAQKLREGSYFTEQPAATLPDGFELE
jgi:hypothetical protein